MTCQPKASELFQRIFPAISRDFPPQYQKHFPRNFQGFSHAISRDFSHGIFCENSKRPMTKCAQRFHTSELTTQVLTATLVLHDAAAPSPSSELALTPAAPAHTHAHAHAHASAHMHAHGLPALAPGRLIDSLTHCSGALGEFRP